MQSQQTEHTAWIETTMNNCEYVKYKASESQIWLVVACPYRVHITTLIYKI